METEIKTQEVAEELDTLTAEQMKANLEADVRAYNKSLETAKKDYENYKRQMVYTEEMWDILSKPGAVKKLNPTFEYEKNERWWELQQEMQLDKIRQDRAVSEGTIKQFEMQIENITEALASAEEKLAKFGGSDDE